jgi:hypothetical protein
MLSWVCWSWNNADKRPQFERLISLITVKTGLREFLAKESTKRFGITTNLRGPDLPTSWLHTPAEGLSTAVHPFVRDS